MRIFIIHVVFCTPIPIPCWLFMPLTATHRGERLRKRKVGCLVAVIAVFWGEGWCEPIQTPEKSVVFFSHFYPTGLYAPSPLHKTASCGIYEKRK
jgi:hypothetical protein